MRELHACAGSVVRASAEAALALVGDLEGYHRWHPEVVRAVTVLDRVCAGGPACRVLATLRLAQGPLRRDFELTMSVERPDPGCVVLEREPHDPSDPERFTVTWRIAEGSISLSLDAVLEIPRFAPVGGVGDALAHGFVTAAVRELDG